MLHLGFTMAATGGIRRTGGPQTGPEPEHWHPEAEAYFTALATPPNAARKSRVNTLIGALKGAGVWQRLAGLNVVGRDLNAFATDLANPARVGVAVNGPAYVADSHFAGDGVASYLDTTFNPASDTGGSYLQNDCSMAIAGRAPFASAVLKLDCGNESAWLTSQYNETSAAMAPQGGTLYSRPRGSSVDPELVVAWNRTGAEQVSWHVGGERLDTYASTSAALRNAPFCIGAASGSTANVRRFSPQGIRFFRYGLSLTEAQEAAFHAAMTAYFDGLGGDYA